MSAIELGSQQAFTEFKAPPQIGVVRPHDEDTERGPNIIEFPSTPSRLTDKASTPSVSLDQFYAEMYEKSKEHSPEASTVSLARRAMPHIKAMDSGAVVEIGAGRQNFPAYLKRTYWRDIKRKDLPVDIMTVDIAPISSDKLLYGQGYIPFKDKDDNNVDTRVEDTLDNPHALHIRADGRNLPIPSDSVPVVVSNMAYDFMPKEAVGELFRVVKPGGRVFMNLSYPALDGDMDIEDLLKSNTIKPSRKRELRFWKEYLTNNKIVVSSPGEAINLYESYGFIVKNSKETPNNLYDWFELDLYKPTLEEQEEMKREAGLVTVVGKRHTFYD